MSDENTEAAEQAAPEAKIAPEPAPAPVVRRQSVVMRTGSCDMRVGTGALDQLGNAARIAAGKPSRALLVSGDDIDAELTERCSRLLKDAGLCREPHERAARTCRPQH